MCDSKLQPNQIFCSANLSPWFHLSTEKRTKLKIYPGSINLEPVQTQGWVSWRGPFCKLLKLVSLSVCHKRQKLLIQTTVTDVSSSEKVTTTWQKNTLCFLNGLQGIEHCSLFSLLQQHTLSRNIVFGHINPVYKYTKTVQGTTITICYWQPILAIACHRWQVLFNKQKTGTAKCVTMITHYEDGE